jgi:hypothetical protein
LTTGVRAASGATTINLWAANHPVPWLQFCTCSPPRERTASGPTYAIASHIGEFADEAARAPV